MAQSPVATKRREERARTLRNQILDAARTCVIADGFHGATISRICAAASVGVGHLYKIFDSKEAIMIALTARDFEEFMRHITPAEGLAITNTDEFVRRYLDDIPWLLNYDRAALAQEVLAEASRNPKVAELVAAIDDRFRNVIRKMMEPLLGSMTARELDGRVESLLIFTRALSLHASTHPTIDHVDVSLGIEPAIRAILSPIKAAATGESKVA